MNIFSTCEIERIKEITLIKVGLNIKKTRIKKGLTQVELAKKINSDRQYLYKIENAKVGLSVTKLSIIARALDVSMAQLVDID